MLDSKKVTDYGPETEGNSVPALRRQRDAGETITVTVMGKVHQVEPTDAKGFQALLDLVERLETI
jgi:hypothetical protein